MALPTDAEVECADGTLDGAVQAGRRDLAGVCRGDGVHQGEGDAVEGLKEEDEPGLAQQGVAPEADGVRHTHETEAARMASQARHHPASGKQHQHLQHTPGSGAAVSQAAGIAAR